MLTDSEARYILDHMDDKVVYYHANCMDGACAAYILDGEARPARYHDPVPDDSEVAERHVVVVDLSFSEEVLDRWYGVCASLLVLDHHDSAKWLASKPYALFDQDRSGTGIAWDVVFGAGSRPWWVQAVEDHDLWRPERDMALDAFVYSFEPVPDVVERLPARKNEARDAGEALIRQRQGYVDRIAKNAKAVSLLGYDGVLIVQSAVLKDEVGNALASRDGVPFAVVWYEDASGMARLSFRGCDRVRVNDVAALLGGGGHPNAAGAVVPINGWLKSIA